MSSSADQPLPGTMMGPQQLHVESTAPKLPSADLHNPARTSCTSLSTFNHEDPVDQLTDLDENCSIEEAVAMGTKENTKEEMQATPPALPQRSALRSSRLLDSLKFKSIEDATKSVTNPHEMYMSSEEDAEASSSAGDFSADDYDFDSDSECEGSQVSVAGRSSREITARAVSVVYVGKPNVVELMAGRRSMSPPSSARRTHKTSLSTATSFEREPLPRVPRPQSTMIMGARKPKPAFLNTDPFASQSQEPTRRDTSGARPPTPKTPTAVFNRFQRSLGLARKQSRPNLKDDSQESLRSMQYMGGSTATLPLVYSDPYETETPSASPTTHSNILRSARKGSISFLPPSRPDTPMAPETGKKGILGGFNKTRRMSLRG